MDLAWGHSSPTESSLLFYPDPLSELVTLPQGSVLLLLAAPWCAIFTPHMFNFVTCDNLKSITISIPTEIHRIQQDVLRADLERKQHRDMNHTGISTVLPSLRRSQQILFTILKSNGVGWGHVGVFMIFFTRFGFL